MLCCGSDVFCCNTGIHFSNLNTKQNFFIQLDARTKITKDLKIRNVRPSEDVIIEFINWKIDLLSSLMKFKKDLIN